MFNGPWVETERKEIELHIDDKNVTSQALNKVFSSFYQDDIKIESSEAISILGAASLLQMEEISLQCIEVMKHDLNIDTVIAYYDSAELYSLKEVKEMAFDWLLKNLLCIVYNYPSHLCQISCDLMTDLVASPNLVVVQTEFSVYLLLQRWVFLKENKYPAQHKVAKLEKQELDKLVNDYFRSSCNLPYLLSTQGLQYEKAFLALRKNYLICHRIDVNTIEADNIMPPEWFSTVYKQQWYHMLQIGEGVDPGPSELSEEEFNKFCCRVGRVIKHNRVLNWRWTGFNQGFDLVVTYNRGSISLMRRFEILRAHAEIEQLMETMHRDKKRSLMYRIGIYSLDKRGKVISKQETGIETIYLDYNEGKTILTFDCEMKFPLLFSASFLVTTPLQQNSKQNLNMDVEDVHF